MLTTSCITNEAGVTLQVLRPRKRPVCRISIRRRSRHYILRVRGPLQNQRCGKIRQPHDYLSAAGASLPTPGALRLNRGLRLPCQIVEGGTSSPSRRQEDPRQTTRTRSPRRCRTEDTTRRQYPWATIKCSPPRSLRLCRRHRLHCARHGRDNQSAQQLQPRVEHAQQEPSALLAQFRQVKDPASSGLESHTTRKKSDRGGGYQSWARWILLSEERGYRKRSRRTWKRAIRKKAFEVTRDASRGSLPASKA